MTQNEKAQYFKSLHIKSNPVILFNIWDAGSAKTVEAAGAKVLATGSAPVAAAFGYADGENIPLDMALANIARIVNATELPVSMDIEGGYGSTPDEVSRTIYNTVKTGIVGLNFEDQIVGSTKIYDIDTQVTRIAAARSAADKACSDIVLNARTDIFLKAKPDTHNEAMLDEAITRANAYKNAGADVFFAPGLADETLIAKLCASIKLPVNIIALPHVPDAQTLATLGVARISHGPVPYKKMSAWLGAQAKAAFTALG